MLHGQTPPDLGFLQGLDPDIARLALAVTVLGMILFYVGPVIRARLMPKTAAPATTDPGAHAAPAGAAVDRAEQVTDRYVTSLEGQVVALTRERDDLNRRLDRAESELDRMRWQRGDS